MELIELSETDREEYNRFIATNPSGSFLQSWEWGEWQAALGRQVKRLKFKVEGGETLGLVQLIKMHLLGKKHYWYAPYGPVLHSGQWSVVSGQFCEELKRKFSDAVFVRIESKDKSLSTSHYPLVTKSFNIQPAKTLLIDFTKSEDEFLSQMHPKTRYNIKVAQKHGVQIKDEFDISVGHGLFFDEAIRLVLETSKRQKFHTFPLSYYKKLIDFFAVNNRGEVKLHIYKAIFQDQLLAAAIMMDFSAKGGSAFGGGTRTFLFGGSSEFHKNVMAPYLLHWQAMADAKAAGFSFYDFWGIETAKGDTPGFVRFKLGFGGEPKEYDGAYDIINNKFGYRVYSFFRTLNRLNRR